MVRAIARAGVLYKLESTEGTLLGTIMIPASWDDKLRLRGRMEFFVPEPVAADECGLLRDRSHANSTLMVRHALMTRSNGNHRDALMLFGVSPEEFERLPGCAFMPGAAYLRSVAG